MEELEAKEGCYWKRNLTHLEWLIEHWDMYEFQSGTDKLKDEIEIYTRDKRRYYSRAIEAYNIFCENLCNNPCQFELGVTAEDERGIITKNPDGYLVSYGDTLFPCGFLREQAASGKQVISNQVDKWRESLEIIIGQMKREAEAWEQQHEILQSMIVKGKMQNKIWAWLYTLINMNLMLLLVYLIKVVFELGNQNVVITIILPILLICGVIRTWRGIHAIYLAEKGGFAKKMVLKNRSLCIRLRQVKQWLRKRDYQYYFESEEPVILTPTKDRQLENELRIVHGQKFVFYMNQYQLVTDFRQILFSIIWEGLVFILAAIILCSLP